MHALQPCCWSGPHTLDNHHGLSILGMHASCWTAVLPLPACLQHCNHLHHPVTLLSSAHASPPVVFCTCQPSCHPVVFCTCQPSCCLLHMPALLLSSAHASPPVTLLSSAHASPPVTLLSSAHASPPGPCVSRHPTPFTHTHTTRMQAHRPTPQQPHFPPTAAALLAMVPSPLPPLLPGPGSANLISSATGMTAPSLPPLTSSLRMCV
jgi:hypothetical protein